VRSLAGEEASLLLLYLKRKVKCREEFWDLTTKRGGKRRKIREIPNPRYPKKKMKEAVKIVEGGETRNSWNEYTLENPILSN